MLFYHPPSFGAKKPPSPYDEKARQIHALRAEGKTLKEVADCMGMSVAGVQRYLR